MKAKKRQTTKVITRSPERPPEPPPKGSLSWHILQKPYITTQELSAICGRKLSSNLVSALRADLRRRGFDVPLRHSFTRLNPVTLEPILALDKARKALLQIPMRTSKEIAAQLGTSSSTVNRARLLLKKAGVSIPKAKRKWFSKLDSNLEPLTKADKIRKALVQNPNASPTQLASVMGVTPVEIEIVKLKMRKEGYKFPDLRRKNLGR